MGENRPNNNVHNRSTGNNRSVKKSSKKYSASQKANALIMAAIAALVLLYTSVANKVSNYEKEKASSSRRLDYTEDNVPPDVIAWEQHVKHSEELGIDPGSPPDLVLEYYKQQSELSKPIETEYIADTSTVKNLPFSREQILKFINICKSNDSRQLTSRKFKDLSADIAHNMEDPATEKIFNTLNNMEDLQSSIAKHGNIIDVKIEMHSSGCMYATLAYADGSSSSKTISKKEQRDFELAAMASQNCPDDTSLASKRAYLNSNGIHSNNLPIIRQNVIDPETKKKSNQIYYVFLDAKIEKDSETGKNSYNCTGSKIMKYLQEDYNSNVIEVNQAEISE